MQITNTIYKNENSLFCFNMEYTDWSILSIMLGNVAVSKKLTKPFFLVTNRGVTVDYSWPDVQIMSYSHQVSESFCKFQKREYYGFYKRFNFPFLQFSDGSKMQLPCRAAFNSFFCIFCYSCWRIKCAWKICRRLLSNQQSTNFIRHKDTHYVYKYCLRISYSIGFCLFILFNNI